MKDHTFVYHDGWWHLYSISGTAGYCHAFTGNEETFSWSVSKDLVDWEFLGVCARFPLRSAKQVYPTNESLTVMKHPLGGKWYRSGCFGARDRWKLSFTEIEWVPDGAFHIVRPSVFSSKF